MKKLARYNLPKYACYTATEISNLLLEKDYEPEIIKDFTLELKEGMLKKDKNGKPDLDLNIFMITDSTFQKVLPEYKNFTGINQLIEETRKIIAGLEKIIDNPKEAIQKPQELKSISKFCSEFSYSAMAQEDKYSQDSLAICA